jgi:hypothetical protein
MMVPPSSRHYAPVLSPLPLPVVAHFEIWAASQISAIMD